MASLLLVEDDRGIAGALAFTLKSIFDIEIAGSGKVALAKVEGSEYDLIILDLHLPDMPGLEVCQSLRKRGVSAPILILSAEARVLTKINLLDAGANDYLTKPFSLGELKARLRALTRDHNHVIWPQPKLEASNVSLDRQSFIVKRNGRKLVLRPKEFAILACLMEQAGRIVSREALMHSVWKNNDEFWTNTLDVHIKYLRDKLDRPFDKPLITTVHGRGYRFETVEG